MAYKKWEKKEVVKVPQTFDYPPSEEQADMFSFLRYDTGNLHGEAGAGTGKSTTMIRALHMDFMRKYRCGVMAFMKSIQEELEPRMPVGVDTKTSHAFSYGALAKAFGKPTLPDKHKGEATKTEIILANVMPEYDPSNARGSMRGDIRVIMYNLDKLFNMVKATLADWNNEEVINDLMDRYGIDFTVNDEGSKKQRNYWEDIKPNFAQMMDKQLEITDTIDFADMIWLPIMYDLKIPQYDMLFCDEWQDASPMMLELAARMVGDGRVMTIGDKFQCQPAGTMILDEYGDWVDIADIPIGRGVVGYSRKDGQLFSSNRINDKACRPYKGNMFIVSTENEDSSYRESKSTPNHKWYVKWAPEMDKKFIVYLMKRDNQFRIGITKSFYDKEDDRQFGLGMRARQEKADCAWILAVFNTAKEACLYENYWSYEYGIPQLMFESPKAGGNTDKEYLDSFWHKIKDNSSRGFNLLRNFDLEIEYPIWSKADNTKQGFNCSFITHAANLLSGLMMIPIANSFSHVKKNLKWCKITVETEQFEGMVYSLDVDKVKNYISNGQLTCNSIMGFAGADTNSIDNTIAKFNSTSLPLMTCYRCGHEIIKEVNKIMPTLRAYEGNPQGEVITHYDPDEFKMETVPDGSMVLCRRNSGLVRPCFDLLKKGRKAIIKGKEIGEDLIRLIDNQHASTINELKEAILSWKNEKQEGIQKRKRVSQEAIELIEDQYSAVMAFAENQDTVAGIKNQVRNIFTNDKSPGVTLSSMHKAKGLEAKEVVIVQADRMRMFHEKMKPEDHQQEIHLEYVGKTRAKQKLTMVWS